MRARRFVCASVIAGAFACAPSTAAAQESPQALRQEIDQLRKDFEALKQQYGDRLTALETKLASAEGTPPPAAPPAQPPTAAAPAPPAAQVPPGAEGAGGPTGPLPVYGSAVTGSKVFNPDIAVIGDFLGAAGHNDVNPPPALEMHESELSFQAVVDPYARADFFISFGEEGVKLEEGFLTFTDAARRSADEGRQDARGIRQGEHAAQPRPAVDRSSARDAEPGRRRRRHRRCGHLGGAADSESVDLPRGDRPGLPRRLGRSRSSRASRSDLELRRSSARLSGHHANRPTSISAFSYSQRPQRRRRRRTTLDLGASRRSSTASTRRSDGSRCSARSTTRSSAAPS